MDTRVKSMCERVLDGEYITEEDVLYLLETVKPYSLEHFYMRYVAHTLSYEATNGTGLIYSQIGLDANPCPGNCHYCSFAKINNKWEDNAEVPLDIILEYSRVLAKGGVHMISLMITANYDFDKYVNIVSAVRDVIGPNIGIMINMGDFDLEQAKRLKAAGGDITYHAIRVGEGIITSLDPQKRWETAKASIEAGMRFSSGVGPMYHGIDNKAIAERTMQVVEYKPICAGASVLHAVEGTKMSDFTPANNVEMDLYDSIYWMAAGRDRGFYGGENSRWVDAGANPRGREYLVGEDRIKADIDNCRHSMEANGWNVPDNAIPFWELY